eukprot:g1562.t1
MGSVVSVCDSAETENVEKEEPVGEEEVPEEVEETPPPKDYGKNPEFWTSPPDPRFRSVNQSRTCYTRYNEYYKCKLEKDEESEECMFYKRCYETICPDEWIERWEEMREEGIWAGRY